MNKSHRKKTRLIATLAITMIMVFSSSFATSVFAMQPGDKINYQGTHVEVEPFPVPVMSASKSGITYRGTCAEFGTPMAASGNATVAQKVSNNSKEAKMIYHLVYELKWFDSPKVTQDAMAEIGLPEYSGFTYGNLVSSVSQLSHQSRASWIQQMEYAGSPKIAAGTINWYDSYDVSGITVPSNFALYYCTDGSNQPFTIWTLEPKGYVKLKKTSANSSITG